MPRKKATTPSSAPHRDIFSDIIEGGAKSRIPFTNAEGGKKFRAALKKIHRGGRPLGDSLDLQALPRTERYIIRDRLERLRQERDQEFANGLKAAAEVVKEGRHAQRQKGGVKRRGKYGPLRHAINRIQSIRLHTFDELIKLFKDDERAKKKDNAPELLLDLRAHLIDPILVEKIQAVEEGDPGNEHIAYVLRDGDEGKASFKTIKNYIALAHPKKSSP